MCECRITPPCSIPRKPKANPTSFEPSNAPTQMLPASLVATVKVNGITSRSASLHTSLSTASTCSRSAKVSRSRMTTDFDVDGLMQLAFKSVQYTRSQEASRAAVSRSALQQAFQRGKKTWIRNGCRIGAANLRLPLGTQGSYRECHRDAVIAEGIDLGAAQFLSAGNVQSILALLDLGSHD